MNKITQAFLLPVCILCACRPMLPVNESIELARSTENSVEVVISMQDGPENKFTLLATFTPLEAGMHLYSKDIPKTGIGGLGRPTLLALADDSFLQISGELSESIAALPAESVPFELRAYPAGPVTLSLAIESTDAERHTESVFITYMACDDKGCRAPVENKAIEITIPKQ
jgi:hypothetical protein